ncbi:MAG: hypothetical protein J6S38_07040 [Erysipelotrichaceae bacterium]|nr:hypothetical protein [Erysipelotrichaceae bacterium]
MFADLQKCKHRIKYYHKAWMMKKYEMKQYISRDELHDSGYSTYRINRLVQQGELIAINKNHFENPQYKGEINDHYSVNAIAPKGVICLLSAAIYHGLSTSRELQIDVAIPRRSRIPDSPDSTVIQFYLFSEERYKTGIVTVTEGENSFMIYNKEKTLCDLLFYRNKLGFEPFAEAMKNYLSSKDRDLNKLMSYAEKLRCGKLMKQYLEIMV